MQKSTENNTFMWWKESYYMWKQIKPAPKSSHLAPT